MSTEQTRKNQIINNKSFSNEELTKFQEDINSLFCEKFNLDQSIPTDIYIPDLDYLLNLSMYAKNGIGLSANQVGISLNMFIMDTNKNPFAFINPKVINKSSITHEYPEGCLSFPGMKINIARSDSIHLEW